VRLLWPHLNCASCALVQCNRLHAFSILVGPSWCPSFRANAKGTFQTAEAYFICVYQSAIYLPIPLPLSLDCFPPGCCALAALGVCTGVLCPGTPVVLGCSRAASVPTLTSGAVLGLAASESCPNLLSLEGAVLRPASAFASTASPACADMEVVCGSGTVTFADAFAAGCVTGVSSLTGTCTSSAALQTLSWHEYGG